MELTNMEMVNDIQQLKGVADKVTGKLAYAVARNMRKLSEEVVEFETIKNNLIEKYGELSEQKTYFIKPGTPAYGQFLEEIREYTDLKCTVDIFKVAPEELYHADLNANEILSLDFMIDQPCEPK